MPLGESEVILIVTVPFDTAVINPLLSTVATLVSLLSNLTAWIFALDGLIDHSNWYVSYLFNSVILLSIETDSTGVASTNLAYTVIVSSTVVTTSPVNSGFVYQPTNL